ncbi:hypothetical protein AX16_006568 [Volvariella volvacea WC 439]|nr:hypothetical protein AX16_006568 [Volvariella volvacea WC 439]
MHALLAPLAFYPHGILILRAYGFSGQKKLYLAVMLICYTLQIALDIWVYCFDTRPLPEPFYMRVGNTGCFPDYSDPDFMIRIGLTMLGSWQQP